MVLFIAPEVSDMAGERTVVLAPVTAKFVEAQAFTAVDELDALVVVAEQSMIAPGSFRYHLVLHWKQHRAPLMVLESEVRVSLGGPQMGGQLLVAKATKYARAMSLPVYDNTHMIGSCPVTVWS